MFEFRQFMVWSDFCDFDFFFDVSKKAARRVWGVEGEGRSGMQILVADRKIDRFSEFVDETPSNPTLWEAGGAMHPPGSRLMS